MKIKTTKQMRLDELIKYIDGNEEAKGEYFIPTPLRGGVTVTNSGQVKVESVYLDDTFTVDVEEELTEETAFDWLLMVSHRNHIQIISPQYATIQGARHRYNSAEKFYTLADGEIQLIWSKDTGIPAEGVIEV